jgi:hypothetical protein
VGKAEWPLLDAVGDYLDADLEAFLLDLVDSLVNAFGLDKSQVEALGLGGPIEREFGEFVAAVEHRVALDDPAELFVLLQEGFLAIDLEADESPDALQFGGLFLAFSSRGLGVRRRNGQEEQATRAHEHDGLPKCGRIRVAYCARWRERGQHRMNQDRAARCASSAAASPPLSAEAAEQLQI